MKNTNVQNYNFLKIVILKEELEESKKKEGNLSLAVAECHKKLGLHYYKVDYNY